MAKPTFALETLSPKARDDLRRILIHDQADRDSVSSQLLRYRDGHGDDWADIIDFLTMHPEERRKVARLLGEIERLPSNVRRAGQAGERRGTRPLFASSLALKPAPHLA